MGSSYTNKKSLSYLKKSFISAQKKPASGVEIVLLKMIFESRRDASGAIGPPGYISLSPVTVSRTR